MRSKSAWDLHLASYRASHRSLCLKDCMFGASKTYRNSQKVSTSHSTGSWYPKMGIMEYAEVRIRDVQEGKVDMSEFKGYLWSEKMDGWHVVWDGKDTLYTKKGVPLPAPQAFKKLLPPVAISGELVVRREQATKVAELRRMDGPWGKARMYVFDMPAERTLPFKERTTRLKKIVQEQCREKSKCPLRYIEQHTIRDTSLFMKEFESIVQCTGKYEKDGSCFGEGVVITNPKSLYTSGRCDVSTRFKLKRREDAEAVVIGHNAGSLKVRFGDVEFNLGIGLTSKQRSDLPRHFPTGTVVKFSFRSLGQHGKPKEARLMGRRFKEDMR